MDGHTGTAVHRRIHSLLHTLWDGSILAWDTPFANLHTGAAVPAVPRPRRTNRPIPQAPKDSKNLAYMLYFSSGKTVARRARV